MTKPIAERIAETQEQINAALLAITLTPDQFRACVAALKEAGLV